ncbi:MAG TPA: UMP kinase [Alphaproteobacteria bacterium]|nr:UMP kinase [Alphaproteobacteria bacterium]
MALRRVLVKVSGERFGGDEAKSKSDILDGKAIALIAREIKSLQDDKLQVGVVIGGGNIVRGREAIAAGIEDSTAHQMGMLATVINGLALQSALEQLGVPTRVMTAVTVYSMAEPYIKRRAVRHMEKGRVVILAAGTGNPFFTTDTAGALRAIELQADLLIKATKVDGIYSADPVKDKKAKHFAKVSYKEVLVDDLKVMDANAIALCREHKLPLMVCKLGEIRAALAGKAKSTRVG